MKKKQADVYYQAGNDFLKQKHWMSAIASYKDAIRFNPRHFKAYCNLGVCYKHVGLLKQAEDIFTKALKLRPNDGVVFNNLGNVYMDMNRFEEAKQFYLKALHVFPNYLEAQYNLGQIYHFTGDTKKSINSRINLEKMRTELKKTSPAQNRGVFIPKPKIRHSTKRK